jgi:hypothetical protein
MMVLKKIAAGAVLAGTVGLATLGLGTGIANATPASPGIPWQQDDGPWWPGHGHGHGDDWGRGRGGDWGGGDWGGGWGGGPGWGGGWAQPCGGIGIVWGCL